MYLDTLIYYIILNQMAGALRLCPNNELIIDGMVNIIMTTWFTIIL